MTLSIGDTVKYLSPSNVSKSGVIVDFLIHIDFGEWIAVGGVFLGRTLEDEYSSMKEERCKLNLPCTTRYQMVSSTLEDATHVKIEMDFYKVVVPVGIVSLVSTGLNERSNQKLLSIEKRVNAGTWLWT